MPKGNLIPQSERTKEEQSRIAKMGGKKSGEVRRAKKGMQEIAKWILEMPLNSEPTAKEIKSFAEFAGKNITVEQAIMIKQLQKALKGDINSAIFVRDTSGQKPVEVQQVTNVPIIEDDIK